MVTGLQNAQTPTNSRSIELQKQQPSDSINERPMAEGEPPKSDAWLISIKDKLTQAQNDDAPNVWDKLCIYRIPQCLRDCNNKAYIPQIVSIGPYHHGKKRLRSMDRHKWRALHHILRRTNQEIEVYLDAVKEVEEKARACYEGPICLSSNEFVEMMVLDGCFILELFLGVDGGFTQLGYSRNDPIFAMRDTMFSIRRDMIMLENQIPFFILDMLFSLQTDQKENVAELVPGFFEGLMPPLEPPTKSDGNQLESSLENATSFDPLTDQGGLHCLEVFRRSLLAIGTGPNKPDPCVWIKCCWSHNSRVVDKRSEQLIHCVMELKDAGIKFRRRKTDRFWDVKFNNGILEIPCLLIQDDTKSLFLNLIAFEQCHLDSTNDITSYVIFMDSLINSPEDVSYLHYCGIIENWLGSDAEVADLFNRLCQEVVLDPEDSYLSNLSEEVNRYYGQRWNAWRASLNHKYFNSPWAIISLVAAVMLLALTFVQTFYSVYGYYIPHS